MTLDRLRHEPLAADTLDEEVARDLALAEAGDLRRLREIGCGMLDGVMHVVRRHLNGEPDPVLGQFLDLGLHPAIQAERLVSMASPCGFSY